MTRVALALGRGPDSQATLSTAQKAAELWLTGKADYILVSGRWSVFSTVPSDTTEADTMKALALDIGVPKDRVLVDDQARDTVSNMTESKKVLAAHGITKGDIIVITIPHADKRVEYVARKIFSSSFHITTIVSDYTFPESLNEEADVISQERKILLAMRLILIFVRAGNIKAIQRRLRLCHPGYRRSKVAEPITLI